jgi:hypothetical protein
MKPPKRNILSIFLAISCFTLQLPMAMADTEIVNNSIPPYIVQAPRKLNLHRIMYVDGSIEVRTYEQPTTEEIQTQANQLCHANRLGDSTDHVVARNWFSPSQLFSWVSFDDPETLVQLPASPTLIREGHKLFSVERSVFTSIQCSDPAERFSLSH